MMLGRFDPSTLSYKEFIEYFFTKPTGELWILDPDGKEFILHALSHPETILRYLTHFFVEFRQSADRLPLETLDDVITGMVGAANFELQSVLWNNSLDLNDRIQCIRSMYRVFADFVCNCEVEVLVGCFYMWWDNICSSFWFEKTRSVPTEDYNLLGEQDHALLDAMFGTLAEILKLDDDRTKYCALHGLGHLHHPEVRSVVQEFIDDRRPQLEPSDLSWLEKCRDGTVM
jgi:hypothetical protein